MFPSKASTCCLWGLMSASSSIDVDCASLRRVSSWITKGFRNTQYTCASAQRSILACIVQRRLISSISSFSRFDTELLFTSDELTCGVWRSRCRNASFFTISGMLISDLSAIDRIPSDFGVRPPNSGKPCVGEATPSHAFGETASPGSTSQR